MIHQKRILSTKPNTQPVTIKGVVSQDTCTFGSGNEEINFVKIDNFIQLFKLYLAYLLLFGSDILRANVTM